MRVPWFLRGKGTLLTGLLYSSDFRAPKRLFALLHRLRAGKTHRATVRWAIDVDPLSV